ncbi:hypothetical protein GCM10011613_16510 [Cellvibrio zantedeschiae]|uniref:Uncharacterized protein n=1 Tax=Cellvibrio zantedeschiae TaxID=1237077 RepID=A0ABQ3AZ34_9GAMM|nr:hypothetical protein [Cellvibrio zantedeschiae]GGY72248.1 hypothetical protein GCM10011613_16510 [Cellvibrio zantedeschiae]
MFNSTVLEVAIGLIFCFASVALIASSIYEAIASWMNLRSKTLLCGLTELLNAKTDEGHELLLSIYNDALAHPAGNGSATKVKDIKNKPAYIPSKNFALALIHSIQEVPGKLDNLEAGINSLKDEQLRALLQNLYRKAEGNFHVFQHEIATWFDTGMGRVSGAYKKQSQIWCFVIAFVIAAGFNIDCVHLFKTLWLHPASIAQLQLSESNTFLATQAYSQLQTLPVGWNGHFEFSMLFVPSSIIGWLVTASASLFGAPFWFDVLKMLVRLRGTGTKPEGEPPQRTTEPAGR